MTMAWTGSVGASGGMFVAAVSECLAKMLYAAGRREDVNAGWFGAWYSGGPGFM